MIRQFNVGCPEAFKSQPRPVSQKGFEWEEGVLWSLEMLWLFFEIWTTSFDWKHATCPLVAGKIWPLIIVNIRNISIYIMIWRDMIWWDFSSFVSKHEHDQTCVLRSFSSSNVKTGCSSTLWLACAHQEHFVNGHWCNFPGIMSCNKVLLPVHRRNPPKPQLLLQKPISLSTFLFASSSPAWARRRAEEPNCKEPGCGKDWQASRMRAV